MARPKFLTPITDASGQFKFLSLPPGSYKVFAWESVEQFSWFDPTVLARYEAQGMPATVNESSNASLDLRIIPAAGAR